MIQQQQQSPRIVGLSWGNMNVRDIGRGKDFKLWPGGGREWDWGETGTHHVPGIQPADVEELVAHGAREVVLSRGMLLALQTCDETRRYLERQNIMFHIAETRKAAKIYNERADQGIPVGGLFHSTC